MSNVREPERRLADGELLPLAGLQVPVLATPGRICPVDEANGLILAGDHVLPRIILHASLETRNQVDPLADWLASLADMEVGADMEALPAHEYRFRGLEERVGELQRHTWLPGELLWILRFPQHGGRRIGSRGSVRQLHPLQCPASVTPDGRINAVTC